MRPKAATSQGMQIVLWVSVLTDHQIHTFRALQELLGQPIHFVIGRKMLEERKAQGWCEPKMEDLSIEILPKLDWWRVGHRVLKRYPQGLHMFCGLWADRRFFPFLLKAQLGGISTALMMEPFPEHTQSYFGEHAAPTDAIKSRLRPLAYWVAGHLVARRLVAAFPISNQAIVQVKAMGLTAKRIFPFGYFVPRNFANSPATVSHATDPLRLVFVGSLIARKGLPTLLEAVKRLRNEDVDILLDVYGPGNASTVAGPGIDYRGIIPFGSTQNVIRSYDLLVLPSLHDGWGVVVNEALMQGVPVLVSNACGAKTLIEVSGAGNIFEAGSADDLMRALRELSQPGRLSDCQRNARAYRSFLTPAFAAQQLHNYLANLAGNLGSEKLSPWYL